MLFEFSFFPGLVIPYSAGLGFPKLTNAKLFFLSNAVPIQGEAPVKFFDLGFRSIFEIFSPEILSNITSEGGVTLVTYNLSLFIKGAVNEKNLQCSPFCQNFCLMCHLIYLFYITSYLHSRKQKFFHFFVYLKLNPFLLVDFH